MNRYRRALGLGLVALGAAIALLVLLPYTGRNDASCKGAIVEVWDRGQPTTTVAGSHLNPGLFYKGKAHGECVPGADSRLYLAGVVLVVAVGAGAAVNRVLLRTVPRRS